MFGEYLRQEQEFNAVVLTGDIAEAHNVVDLLQRFASGIGEDRQIYFLAGNHDFYGGSIKTVFEKLSEPLAPNLVFLDAGQPILLDDDTALVGKFAWYDAMLGNGIKSDIVLHDFEAVAEFRAMYQEYAWVYEAREGSRNQLLGTLRLLAREATTAAKASLVEALKLRKQVVFATHVPPFAGACWHEGRLSNADWMPWFTCDIMGRMLTQVAEEHPNRQILVLCGHTHSSGVYQPAPNLKVLTGQARYGAPDVAGVLDQASFEGWV